MFEFITSWLGITLVSLLAGLLTYGFVVYALRISQASIGGALLFVATFWILLAIGREFFVPEVDKTYVAFKEDIEQSNMYNDAMEIVGIAQAGIRDTTIPTLGPGTQQPDPTYPPQPTLQPTPSTAPVVHFGATTVDYKDGTRGDVCGWAPSLYDNKWVYDLFVICKDDDTPSLQTIPSSRVKQPFPSGIPSPPQPIWVYPPTQLPPPTPTPAPTQDPTTYNKCVAELWTTWANSTLPNKVQYGLKGLPFGFTWILEGPGWWGGSFGTVSQEEWHLTSLELGIADYIVNGFFGRSIPGHKKSGQIEVIGQGVEFTSQCKGQ